jgi:hypothetical protein
MRPTDFRENIPIWIWHAACCNLWRIVMKEPDIKPKVGHNWNWPRKTWLQERLDIIKARERENNPKPEDTSQNSAAVDADTTRENKPEET